MATEKKEIQVSLSVAFEPLLLLYTDYENPPHDISTQKLASAVCGDQTIGDNTTMEWTPVLSRTNELGGNVGLSGEVLDQKLSGSDNDFSRDMPFLHPFYNDWECYIAPDKQYASLLAPNNSGTAPKGNEPPDEYWTYSQMAKAKKLSDAVIGLETDRGLVPEEYRAHADDRIALLGRWIVDCGHEDFHTEIHPPLLMAVARKMASEDGTSVKVIGRPFLVSQIFDGDSLLQYLINKELVRVEGESYAAGFAGPFAPLALDHITPLTARPKILSPGFSGTETFYFYVTPPSRLQSPDDELLLSYHFTVRSGVVTTVEKVVNQDAVKVTVSLTNTGMQTNPPPSHDVNVQISDLGWDKEKPIVGLGSLNPLAGPVIAKGLVTNRYDLPRPNSIHDSENVVTNVVVDQITPAQARQTSLDDSQPYPIYGWITLRWERHPWHLSIETKEGGVCVLLRLDTGVVEDITARFSANISGISKSKAATLTYQWTVSGAVPEGPTNQQDFSAKMPKAPSEVTVTVTITDPTGFQLTHEGKYMVFTQQQADDHERVCAFVRYMQSHPILRPPPFHVPPGPGPDPGPIIKEFHQLAQDFAAVTGRLIT